MNQFYDYILLLLPEKQMNIVDNLSEMKKSLMGVGVDHCEGSGGLECFEVNQAKLITQYMHTR